MQCTQLTTALLILGLPSLALAAPQQPGSPPQQQTPRASATDEVATYATVSKLIGANVWSRADAKGDREDVADINDFIVDATTGKVDFVVLSSGGVGSVGDSLRRVPFSDLSIEHTGDDDECKVLIGVGKDEFERIAKIEEKSLEPYRAKTIAAASRDQGTAREAGGQKGTTGVSDAQMRVSGAILASDLDDLEVRATMGSYDADGKAVKADELGSIDEAWINTATGNIEYLTFEHKDRKLVIPHRALASHIDAEDKELYFVAPAVAERLAQAPAFDDAKKWDLKNAEFRRKVDSFYADLKGAADKAGDAIRKVGDGK